MKPRCFPSVYDRIRFSGKFSLRNTVSLGCVYCQCSEVIFFLNPYNDGNVTFMGEWFYFRVLLVLFSVLFSVILSGANLNPI